MGISYRAMKRFTQLKAIGKYCYEHSGKSPKEVSLCHQFDCPLWFYRFGCTPESDIFSKRTERIKKDFQKELKVLEETGIDTSFFFENHKQRHDFRSNEQNPIPEHGLIEFV